MHGQKTTWTALGVVDRHGQQKYTICSVCEPCAILVATPSKSLWTNKRTLSKVQNLVNKRFSILIEDSDAGRGSPEFIGCDNYSNGTESYIVIVMLCHYQ